MAKGRAVAIELVEAEKQALTALTRKHGAPQSIAVRARIVLAAASGLTNTEIAAKLDVCAHTAGLWRRRFARDGMDGLYDEPRPGAPRQIGDNEIAATIRKTLETRPQGATHWSLRTMAKAVGHAPSTIHRIWQAFGLQPHRSETFKLSSDPLFVDKVRDIAGLYLSPPERAVVLCVDEKSQVQALDRTQPLLPMRPGQAERRTHDYTRHGTTSLFAALDVKVGTIIGKCMPRHRTQEFRKFLDEVERNVPAAPRCARHHGQLRHTQDRADPQLVCQTATLARPLHAYIGVVDQSGGTLLRATDRPRDQARRVPIRRRPRAHHHRLYQRHQCRSQTVPIDQDRRRHPRLNPTLLPSHPPGTRLECQGLQNRDTSRLLKFVVVFP